MLSDEFIACREVEDEVGTSQCQLVARRSRSPYILAYLYAKLHAVIGAENLHIRSQLHLVSGIADLAVAQILGRGKPALLIELTVVREIGLRHDAQDLSVLDHDTAIQQQIASHYRSADNGDDVEFAGEIEQHHHRLL